MDFGERLLKLRKQNNLSQNELAKKLSIHKNVLGKYERNEVRPSIEIASKIADTLQISLDYLVGKTDMELDKKVVNRVMEIQTLPDEDKKHILYTIDALLQNVRTRLAFTR